MMSPVFWGRANMMYDKYIGIPPKDSPLEALFVLVWLQRHESDLLATRALIHALRAKEGDEDHVVEAFEKYCAKMFPFFKQATNLDMGDEKKALLEFVKRPLRLKLADIYRTQAQHLKKMNRKRRKPQVPQVPDRFRMRKK